MAVAGCGRCIVEPGGFGKPTKTSCNRIRFLAQSGRVMKPTFLRVEICVLLLGLAVGLPTASAETNSIDEARFLSNIRPLTFQGRRSGEGYFSPDGRTLIFQS